jgi:streptomycin 6-kinase
LLATQRDVVALHGDMHHENVLRFGSRGWLAIDPKGLTGERGFDYANIFCNPDGATATMPGRLARQTRVVAEAAGFWNAVGCWHGFSLGPVCPRPLVLTMELLRIAHSELRS